MQAGIQPAVTDCIFFDHGHGYCGLFEWEYLHGERQCPCGLYCTEQMKAGWLGPVCRIPVTPGQAKITDY